VTFIYGTPFPVPVDHLRLHDAFRGSQDLLTICQITHPARFDKPREAIMLGMTGPTKWSFEM